MPIRPENRKRYPADWKQVRERILRRAHYRCEHDGCTARHRELGYWHEDSWVRLPFTLREAGVDRPCTIESAEGPVKIIQIVLTIAHLDHTPENCADDNLRAWCQKHHLRYDAHHHTQTAYATRRARANTPELF